MHVACSMLVWGSPHTAALAQLKLCPANKYWHEPAATINMYLRIICCSDETTACSPLPDACALSCNAGIDMKAFSASIHQEKLPGHDDKLHIAMAIRTVRTKRFVSVHESKPYCITAVPGAVIWPATDHATYDFLYTRGTEDFYTPWRHVDISTMGPGTDFSAYRTCPEHDWCKS